MFAMHHFEHDGVQADIVVTAKSLAGGMTLSAVTGRAEIMDAPAPGGLGGTYAGNPLAVAAALAVIEVMRDEALPERGTMLGEQLQTMLLRLTKEVPEITDVRGLGAMVAVEFIDMAMTKRVQAIALAAGLILLTCGVDGNVVRFLFPLTIEQHLFDEALQIVEVAIKQASTQTS
jgi:4-aminobutyrate aminotransferase